MTLPEEVTNRSNIIKLSQLKNILNKKYFITSDYIQAILRSGFDINCSIPSTPYLELKQSNLIGCTALHLAFMENCIEGFEILLNNGADYTIKNGDGMTVLHQVVEDYNKDNLLLRLDNEFATLIMSAHINNSSNPSTTYGLSHFHAACLYNNVELVKLFLDKGESAKQSVNSDSKIFPSYSPLHFVVKSIYGFETAKILIEFGADVNVKNAEGKTPLVMLVEQIIELFNRNKIDILVDENSLEKAQENQEQILNLLHQHSDYEGLSSFHVACIIKDSSMLESMLKNNVDIDQAIAQDSSFWPGFTGLHFAALCNIKHFFLLLEKGANVEIKNASGLTAFEMRPNDCRPVVVHKMLSAVKIWKDILLSDNETSLLEMVDAMENTEKLKAFFESSPRRVSAFVPIDSPLWPGFTILHVTVQVFISNLEEIVKTCLEAGAQNLARCANGSTALHLAFQQEKIEDLSVLCQHYRENPDVTNNENLSHLHIACATPGQEDFVTSLLQTGADVNTAYTGKPIGSFLRTRFTPLHIAVVRGDCEMVRALLERGADRYALDSDDFTPIHWVLGSPNSDDIGKELLTPTDVRESIVSGLSHLHVASYIKEFVFRRNEVIGSNDFIRKLLAETGANVDEVVRYDEGISLSFFKKVVGLTPLSLAVQKKNPIVTELLVKSGADILARQPNGLTPFYDLLNLDEYNSTVCLFNSIFKDNDEIQRQVIQETGLTMLHLACYTRDEKKINCMLENGENLNAPIHLDSPIWPGYTAFHIIVRYRVHPSFFNKLRLNCDTILQNADGDTSLHLAYKYRSDNWLRHLLRRGNLNYNHNPVNKEGLSHFHIVCAVKDYNCVDEFLRRPVDVNTIVNLFSELSIAGQSALHLALNKENFECASDDSYWCWKTVNLLLENGAQVNAKDPFGETSLHKAVKLGKVYVEVLRSIVEAGANVNAIDIFGVSALELLLVEGEFSTEQLKIFIKRGCNFNMFNPMDETGYVAVLFINHDSESEEKKIVFNMMLEYPRTIDADEKGRTIIHNLIANSVTSISADEYAKIIEQLFRLCKNCGIDDQDDKGRTALHVATYHGNDSAIEGLLLAGADINITDNDGDFAIKYLNEDESNEESIIIARHVRKLELLGLDTSQQNRAFAVEVFQTFNVNNASLREAIQRELELAKSVQIISPSLRLHDFLSEFSTKATSAIIGNPTRIERFFRDFEDERFVELRSVLKLQYRKALARPALIEQACFTLKRLRCPMECADFIAKFLTNNDLKNFVKAMQID